MPKTILQACFASLLTCSSMAMADTAVFAGGCFWCMESAFQEVPGVTDVVSGFSGGSKPNPSYQGDHSGHYEAILVSYDPDLISYESLLELYWRIVDPLDSGGQFCDRGESYRTVIFVAGAGEEQMALASRERVMEKLGGPVVTEILPRSEFYLVDEGHQDYYQKNPLRYKYYRYNCGRDQRLEELWGPAPSH